MTRLLVQRRVFGGHSDGPHLLITGGVHGDEFEPIAAIRSLIQMFDRREPRVARFGGRVTLVPVVNKSAFLRGHRTADDGLDLARTCPGRDDGSITERIAAELSRLIESADFYIDLHTGGTEYSVWPLAGYVLHRDSAVLESQRAMARAFNLPVVWGTAGDLNGRSLSVARDAGVPAIYCEYLGSATSSSAGVAAYKDGCLNVMTELGMLDQTHAESQVRYTVEDPRPGSGHMQVCHPAPFDGIFEPSVPLGAPVKAGEAFGIVHDLLGERSEEIRAEESGLVLVQRTFPRILNGSSAGVVLPLDLRAG